LDQPLVFAAALLHALQLVAGAAEGAARRVAQLADRGGGLLAGVDEVFVQRAEDAIPARVDLADLLAVPARGLDHARGAGVDDGRDAARLCIERVSCHRYPSTLKIRSRTSSTVPIPSTRAHRGAFESPDA